MTDALQITRKNFWQVNGANHTSSEEAFQDAASQAFASPGDVVQVQPPAYTVVYTAPTQAPTVPSSPSDPTPVPSSPAEIASNVVAACEIAIDGQAVTFTDKTVSARELVSVQVGYGLGSSPVTIPAGGSITKTYPNAGVFSAALTAIDDAGVKSVVMFKLIVPDTSDSTYTAGTYTTSTSSTPPPSTDPVSLSASARILTAALTAFAADTSVPTTGSKIKSVSLDWGDGSPVEQAQTPTWASTPMFYAQHSYANAGTYTVTYTVADGSGVTQIATYTAVVREREEPSIAGASGTVTVTGEIAGAGVVNVVAHAGQRLPLIPGKLSGSVVWHGDGKSVCLENGYCGLTDDLFGDFTVYHGPDVVFRGPLAIWAYTRARPFWLVQPQVRPDADLSKFPNFGPGTGNESLAADYAAGDNSPMGLGALISTAIGNGGEHPYLGSLTQWDASYIVNPTPENAAVVRGCADACSVMGFIMLDPATNAMLDVTQYPKASWNAPQRGVAGNPIAQFQTINRVSLGQAQTHAPTFCCLSSELFGTDYDKETLSLWCNFVNSLYQNYAYRLPAGCTGTDGIPRATGRGMVVLSYASILSDRSDYFKAWMLATLADFTAKYKGQTGIQVVQKSFGYPHNGFGPWLQHLLVYGIGCAMHHGYVNADSQFAMDFFAAPLLDSMLVTQNELATVYNSQWADDNGVVAKDWAQGLQFAAQNQPKLAAALQCVEGSQALQDALQSGNPPGYFSGYPTAPDGYPAIAQPAFAVIKDFATDQVRATAAWEKFNANAVAHIDHSTNPKYNIVPKVA